ncbi:hypothetical protein [Homoserinibacter sp. YIM 151385]|uniref:hypothetical protein n=1 Tax=Homoserinibacter sp. YIM 151385 TaxID=2985506 RepID=UPI0022EFED6B|nr:hypothetical protein [Homoserinibacter sp. YIM 151385]WBU37355.1 hypothetical protein OF852_10575 [Homoserinibacter sp. YIM 151385]
MTTVHQLRKTSWTSTAARRWRSIDLAEAARSVVSNVVGPGETLPLTRFAGALVFPVVEWRSDSLWMRLDRGLSPLLHPAAVGEVLSRSGWCRDYPSVLSMVGFIGVAPLSQAREELAGLRSMGRTVAMTPRWAAASSLALAEFDLQGTAVVSLEEELQVLVDGDAGIRRGSAMSPVWRRFYEEQLFDWAMKTDSLPTSTA